MSQKVNRVVFPFWILGILLLVRVAFAQVEGQIQSSTSLNGLIYANLTFIFCLVFYSGAVYQRIKGLEKRVDEVELQEKEIAAQGEELAVFKEMLVSVKDRVEHTNKGVHDLRNLLMEFVRDNKR